MSRTDRITSPKQPEAGRHIVDSQDGLHAGDLARTGKSGNAPGSSRQAQALFRAAPDEHDMRDQCPDLRKTG